MTGVAIAAGVAAACRARGGDPAERGSTLTIRGSDTMVILAQRWAEAFMAHEPESAVQVSGGGTGTGFTALIDGTADVATASRPITASEREHIERKHGVSPTEIRVAIDAVAIYVHRDNPTTDLSLAQIKDVFRGRVHDWSALGQHDLGPIVLYSRENNSGTYTFFKEHVLRHEDFAAEAQTLPGTAAVINAVSKDEGAIGYGGIGFAKGVRVLPIRREDGTVVIPTLETAKHGRYPLARPLFLYTVGTPHPLAERYLALARSLEGQALVEALGYFPLPMEPT